MKLLRFDKGQIEDFDNDKLTVLKEIGKHWQSNDCQGIIKCINFANLMPNSINVKLLVYFIWKIAIINLINCIEISWYNIPLSIFTFVFKIHALTNLNSQLTLKKFYFDL